jgi:hypothetical protein
MATITDANLTITHGHTKKLARAVVRCKVNFTALELCQMKTCAQARLFKLKCQLWGADSGLTGADDHLFTYTNVFFYPDATPNGSEAATFEVTLGEGVLDEDIGRDEVYGRLQLTNLYTLGVVNKNTNEVSHRF